MSKRRFSTRKALTQTQTIAIVAVVIVAAVAIYYLWPKPKQENRPPSAMASVSDTIAQIGDSLSFSASGSSDLDDNIDSYAWDFGDGETGSGESVSHSYSNPGRYIVSLVVTDEEDLKDMNDDDLIFIDVSRETVIPVLDSPPQAKIGADMDVIVVGDTVSFDGISSSGWYDRRGVVTQLQPMLPHGNGISAMVQLHLEAKSPIPLTKWETLRSL